MGRRAAGHGVGRHALNLLDTSLVVERLLSARTRASFESEHARRWVARPSGDLLEDRLHEREALTRIREELDSQPKLTDEELRNL